MHSFFFVLCVFLSSHLLAGTAATTENHPSALVSGVNVITGDLYLLERDVTVQGAEPIHLERSYISEKGNGYWNMFSYHRAFVDFSNHMIEIIEPSGARLFYRWKTKYNKKGKEEKKFYSVDPEEENSKGLTNIAKGKPSGRNNLKNQTIHLGSDNDRLSVVCPDGTRRVYVKEHFYDVEEFMDWNTSSLPSNRTSFLLVKEELPNRRQIRYEWPKNKKDVWEIKTCDRDQKYTYSWVKFYPHQGKNPKTGKKEISHGDYGVETSDGRHLEFSFFSHNKIHQLKQVTHNEKPDQNYKYLSYKKKQLLTSILSEEGLFTHIEYYILGSDLSENDPVSFRVKELNSPLGDQGSSLATHRFFYDVENKKTTVLDCYDVPTDYYWNDDLRLTQIDRFTKPGILYNRERFIWGANGSQDASNLLCKILFDEKETPISATRYFYDSTGNIEKETFYGNLSGKGSSLRLDHEGFPIENEVEHYSKLFTYSQDEKNLLLSQEEDSGLSVSYAYLQNTHLITSETHFSRGTPQKTKQYTYDVENGVLTQESTKDLQGNLHIILQIFPKSGSKVEQKKGEYRYPKIPSRIEEYHGEGHLITETKLSYAAGGRLSQKQVYVNKPQRQELRFSKYEYDRGNLTAEIDFYGDRLESTYDRLNRLKSFKDFGGRSKVQFAYDLAGRPFLSEETGEGLHRRVSCRYNNRGNKVEAYDYYGNKTSYEYDPFGHTLKTYLPSGGVIACEYDASGNLILITDPKGNTTRTVYSAYNKPIQIFYPNGSSEQFFYSFNGNLTSHIDQEGLVTEITYDVFGRPLSKKTPFSEETFTYDSFNLLSETDAEGRVTSYEYDAGGRKVLEKKGNEEICYSYDRLGRVHHTTLGTLSLITEHNPLDQVFQEKKLDSEGNLLHIVDYTYDSSRNLVSVKKQMNGTLAEEIQEYDAFKRLTSQKDAEGVKTQYTYDDHNHKETLTDALGSQTLQTLNAEDQITALERRSPKGDLLFQEAYLYDLNQNLIEKQTLTSSSSTITRWNYNEMDQVVDIIEAAGTPLEKVTSYSYTPKGLLYETIKPSGTRLTHIYHPLGYLKRQFSSDRTVDYQYMHDRTGLLQESLDRVSESDFSRSYTDEGRLKQETFNLGSFENSYDSQGRRTLLTLPDASSISYEYDPLYLKSVSKIKQGKTLYTHKYVSHDLSGHLLEERSIGDLTPITHRYDRLGRRIAIESNYFSEKITLFDPVGNLLGKQRNGETLSYTYDDLYQLVSEINHRYKYDALHNRIGKDGASFTVNELNQISELSYDEEGNPLSYEGKTLTYDALDRLISVEDLHQKVIYSYDAFHRRLVKKVYEKETSRLIQNLSYLYDDQNEIGAYDLLSGQIVELRVLGDSSHAEIGAAVAFELYGKTYVPIHDLQGNVSALIPLENGSLESFVYTAFGEENSSCLNPWRFSSKRSDPETGFVFFGRRYYLPSLGRWLTPDPLSFEAGPNLYAFVSNSPLTRFDLYGLVDFSIERIDFHEIAEQKPFHLYNQESKPPVTLWPVSNLPYIDKFKIQNSYTPTTSYTVGQKEIPNSYIIFINGINTQFEEALQYASLLSEYGDGIKVRGVYNPTKDIFSDAIGAFLGTLGKYRRPSDFLASTGQDFFNMYPSGNQKALLICHSDGATHVYEYLKTLHPKNQRRFIILCIAPATIVSKMLCFQSINYASSRDFVPHLRSTGASLFFGSFSFLKPGYSLKCSHELRIVPAAPGTPFLDHSFTSPTFSAKIQERLQKYINSQEIQ